MHAHKHQMDRLNNTPCLPPSRQDVVRRPTDASGAADQSREAAKPSQAKPCLSGKAAHVGVTQPLEHFVQAPKGQLLA